MKPIAIYIEFYGAFRKSGAGIMVEVSAGSTIKQVKEVLSARLKDGQNLLIGDSVLANHEEILPESYVLTEGGTLSILPPVCGG